MTLRKAGGNWVDGDQFFDRDAELEALTERVKDGTHTLLTAQRRMGKTSLVRELLRRLKSEGCFETIFVDLEGARTPADAIAEIGVRSKSVQGVQHKLKSWLANTLREASLEDVDRVYTTEMLGVRGQMDLEHYESRLRMVLGDKGYLAALDILTEAAVNDGLLHSDTIDQYYEYFQAEAVPVSTKDILSVLEHDGYLARQRDNYRFVSGLLEA